jgi:hypothetical protein
VNVSQKLGLAVASGRTLLGVYALSDPRRIARTWLGDHSDDVGGALFGRALAGRDLALGATTVWALTARRHDRQLGAMLVAGGALADAVDAAATLVAWKELPSPWKQATLAAALGSAVTGGVVAGLISAG